jgi:hypothetical protein
MTYKNVHIFAERSVRVRFYDLFEGCAGVQGLRHCGRFARRCRPVGLGWGIARKNQKVKVMLEAIVVGVWSVYVLERSWLSSMLMLSGRSMRLA